LDLRGIAIFTDYFIICSGTSDRMIRSLERTANEKMNSQYGLKGRVEGNPDNGWIAIDFNDIVLHIFSPAQRNYYKLEELWAESKTLLRVK
jgi:ribosome-associated protein